MLSFILALAVAVWLTYFHVDLASRKEQINQNSKDIAELKGKE